MFNYREEKGEFTKQIEKADVRFFSFTNLVVKVV